MEYSKTQWRYLSHQFLQQELLARDTQHGSLRVTQKGWSVLNGGDQFWGFSVESVRHAAAEVLTEYDPELFKLIQTERDRIADAEDVDPNAVFHDKALQAMATYFPTSEESLRVMPSVGPAKAEKYGDVFLPIIRDYYEKHGVESVERTTKAPDEYTPELFEQLRDKRKTVADREGVPAFVVFHDKVLEKMATHLPQSEEALIQIHGVGPAKIEKYADDFLPIICAYCEEHGID